MHKCEFSVINQEVWDIYHSAIDGRYFKFGMAFMHTIIPSPLLPQKSSPGHL